jgi:hypothetical protein
VGKGRGQECPRHTVIFPHLQFFPYPIIEDALHRYSEQRRKGFAGAKG